VAIDLGSPAQATSCRPRDVEEAGRVRADPNREVGRFGSPTLSRLASSGPPPDPALRASLLALVQSAQAAVPPPAVP
jgi:hypothetical protein